MTNVEVQMASDDPTRPIHSSDAKLEKTDSCLREPVTDHEQNDNVSIVQSHYELKPPMEASKKFTDPRYFADNPKREYAYILSTLLSQVFTQAAANCTLPMLDILADYFNSTDAERTWFMSSFSLAQGTLILMSGRIGDIYGLRITVLCGYVWSLIWSILAGISSYAETATFFIVCRAMIGAGLAFVLPNAMGAAGRVYRPGTRRKHMIFSLIGLSAPVGGSSAPIISGLIAEESTQWEWEFYHYGIALAVAFVLGWYSIPYITPHRVEDPEVDVDWIGCAMGVSGMVLLNFVWNQAPNVGWNSPYIIALLVVSIVDLAIFFWYEANIPRNPLLPKQITKDLIMMLTLLILMLSWGSFGILFYRFFIFVLDLRHYNPLEAGACLWPTIPSGMTAAMVCGWLISRIRAQFLLVFSMAVFFCSDVMLLRMPVDQIYWQISFGLWTLGVWGMDWSFPAGSIILSDELPPHLQGMAGSLLTTMVMYGQSLFVGISATIESQIAKQNPGNTLAVHHACSYFAMGLSGSAFIISIVVAYLTLRKAGKRDSRSVSTDEESLHSKTQQ